MNRSSSIQNVEGKWLRSTGRLSRLLLLFSEGLLYTLLPPGQHASPVVAAGRVVWTALQELATNSRHLVGVGLGMVGGISVFAYLLFDETARDYSWYYVNWFYFLMTVRVWLVLFFLSLSFFLLSPSKWRLSWIVASIGAAVGLTGLIHYFFFVQDFDTYHTLPAWYVLAIGGGLGVGIVLSMDYLCFRKYHLKDGNMARIKGIIRVPGIAAEEKIKMLVALLDEQENFNARV